MSNVTVFKIRLKYRIGNKGSVVLDKEMELDVNGFDLEVIPVLNGKEGDESQVSDRKLEINGCWRYDNIERLDYVASEMQMRIPDQIGTGIEIKHLTIPTPEITRGY
jgi:hypothetical protein